MPLPYIIGGLSAASSLIGDIFEHDAAKKAKEEALNAYRKLLIPSSETETRSDRAGDTLYTKAMSELNSGAFAARGALNPETLKTIAYTKMAGARAETEFQVGEEDYKYNRSIQQQIAGIEAQPVPTINPLNAIEAGVGGYFAGKQLDMAESLNESQKSFYDAQSKYYNKQEFNKNSFNLFDGETRYFPEIKSMKVNENNFFKNIEQVIELPRVGMNFNDAIEYIPPVIKKETNYKKKKSTLDFNGPVLTPFKGFNF